MQLPVSCGGQPIQKSLRLDVQFTIPLIEQQATQNKISCMANGQMGTELKFYFHSQMADKSGFFMIEMLFNLQAKSLVYTIKTTRPELDKVYEAYISETFSKFTIG